MKRLCGFLLVTACASSAKHAAGPVPGVRSRAEESPPAEAFSTEQYARIDENPFLDAVRNPLSTFAIDVDTASYANVRRFLAEGRLPPPDAVRLEELVNYFPYAYAPPADDAPFAAHVAAAPCPWRPDHVLVRVALKAREVEWGSRPASNLVFLIDVSGSMQDADKLPLVQRGLHLLTRSLTENDRVAVVVYAGAEGLALPSTPGDRKAEIQQAIADLEAGGSTNGAAGIRLAYRVARENFRQGGVNRVVLCTDGDFNVGTTSQGELTRLIEEQAKSGVFLTVLGFGRGNLKDATMESLADRGNGNYAYVDSLNEARKVLVEQASGTLLTVARDVKVQVEFNPGRVAAYRLLGYENRMLRAEDFNDDRKDAGEIGAGHTVTALYEIVPQGVAIDLPSVDPLKYGGGAAPASDSPELLTLKVRWQPPEGGTSRLVARPLAEVAATPDPDLAFAAAVACWGMVLRGSPHRGEGSFALARELGRAGLAEDRGGHRREFLELVARAQSLGAP